MKHNAHGAACLRTAHINDGGRALPMSGIDRAREDDDPTTFGPLSGREWEVAGLVAGGATNRQIGSALGLTEGTVANHVRSALLKLGPCSRTQLAVWAVRRGEAAGPLREVDAALVRRRPQANGDGIMDGLAERIVFVVGDDRGARGALTGVLVRELGVQAVSMSCGEAAVTSARALHPALVLVDARPAQPRWSDLVRRLRAEPATAGTPVLAVGGPVAAVQGLCEGVLPAGEPGIVVDAVRRWLGCDGPPVWRASG
jgi:DNA-binding NarL/FixJ family response regulator